MTKKENEEQGHEGKRNKKKHIKSKEQIKKSRSLFDKKMPADSYFQRDQQPSDSQGNTHQEVCFF